MEPFIVGLGAGLVLAYLVERSQAVTRGYSRPSIPKAAARLVVFAAVAMAVLLVLWSEWTQRGALEETVGGSVLAFVFRGIAPLGLGLAAGAALFVFGRRLVDRTGEAVTATEASGFGVLAVLVLLVAIDPTFGGIKGALDSLRAAKMLGMEFQFGTARGTGREILQPPSIGKGEGGPDESDGLARTMYYLEKFEEFIKRDHQYASENPISGSLDSDIIKYSLTKDREFVAKILVPTMTAFGKINEGPRYARIIAEVDLPFVRAYRNFVMAVPEKDLEFRTSIRVLREALQQKWQQMCDDPAWSAEREKNTCGVAVMEDFDRLTAEARRNSAHVFNKTHAYGVLSSSLLQFAAREYRTAARDLDAIIALQLGRHASTLGLDAEKSKEQQHDAEAPYLPYELYRALLFQAMFLESHTGRRAERHVARAVMERTMTIGTHILEGPQWIKWLREVDGFKGDRERNGSDCARNSSINFKTFYYSVLTVINTYNYTFPGEWTLDPDVFERVRARADSVAKVDLRCIVSNPDQRGKFAAALLDTQAAIYAASVVASQDEDGSTLRKWSCRALNSALRANQEWTRSLHPAGNANMSSNFDTTKLLDRDAEAGLDEERSAIGKRRLEEARMLARRYADGRCPAEE